MIKLYGYKLEEYNENLLISERISEVDEQISENEFILKAKYFNDVTYETNKVFVSLENKDDDFWQNTQAWVFYKEKQEIKRVANQLKQSILLEIENKRRYADLMYFKMKEEYSGMDVEELEN